MDICGIVERHGGTTGQTSYLTNLSLKTQLTSKANTSEKAVE